MAAMRLAAASVFCAVATATIEQIHITYTGVPGKMAVDFVSTKAATDATAYTSTDGGKTFAAAAASSVEFPSIGTMCQAPLDFSGVAAGAKAQYFLSAAGANSSVYEVTPIVAARPEVFAVFGDFGLLNDVCMDDLVANARAGTFDSVLWVGDWAYNFETADSLTGNLFMGAVQGFGATRPIMPAEGNHEACPACAEVAGLGEQNDKNFTQYKARMRATALYGAGKTSGTNTARYYSFNQGLTHFLVFSGEAYLYARDATFLANQLAFMKADLAAVDRSVTPWVVALVHKDYTMVPEAYAAFSPILAAGKTDVLFCGHVHYYNRFMPHDDVTGEVDTAAISADGATYTNAKYMTIIVTGASGDHEDDDKYVKASPSYTGSENYGYGFFQAVNASHAHWNYHTVKADGSGPKDYTDSLTWVKY